MPSAVPRGQPQTYPNRRVYPNLEEHLSIKTSCFAHYHDVHHDDLPAKLKECSEYLAKWPADKVLNMWRAGEPEAVLETAVRYMSGCTTFKVNPEGALFMLDAFYDPEYNKRDYVGDVASQSAMARAHSCAAHAHYQKFKASDEERLSYTADERHYRRRQTLEVGYGQPAHTSLGFALHHASESARLGHVSAIVLRVGFTAREIGESLGVDLTEMTKRAKKHRPLWRAVEDRLDELYAEARQALQSAERDPSEYICSAEGCSTWSASRASLRLCSGKCPQDLKPRYCSKQCQVKDWSKHKAICKPGGVGKIPKIANKLFVLEFFQLEEPEPPPAPEFMSKAEPENKPEAVQVGAESSDGATLENIEQRKVDKVSERAHDGQERQALESTGEVLDHGEESARKGSGRAPECHASPLSKRSENIEGNERHNPEAHQDQDGEQLESAHGGEEDIVRTLEDALSSPESEWPISPTSSGLSPSRPIIFGSITLEYLNSLWEKEGPEALVNTGVWAKQVPSGFVAPYE